MKLIFFSWILLLVLYLKIHQLTQDPTDFFLLSSRNFLLLDFTLRAMVYSKFSVSSVYRFTNLFFACEYPLHIALFVEVFLFSIELPFSPLSKVRQLYFSGSIRKQLTSVSSVFPYSLINCWSDIWCYESFQIFYIENHITHNRASFISSFLICIYFISFSCFIALAGPSGIVLNKSGEGTPYLVSQYLTEKSLLFLIIKCDVAYRFHANVLS